MSSVPLTRQQQRLWLQRVLNPGGRVAHGGTVGQTRARAALDR